MRIKSAEFLRSTANIAELPKEEYPEFAFVGRSNVGKSSLINMLLERKKLAKTSQKPGKTRTINHFIINNQWFMVDLPGYGYAKVSKRDRKQMLDFIKNYLLYSKNLANLFLLLDSRLEPQKSDMEFIEWLGMNAIPFTMVFTKIDKLSSAQLRKNLEKYRDEMLKSWEFLPKIIKTSATSKHGKTEILEYIDEIIHILNK
ncbi:MAG: ribosome biogenesis GTP-binding protein YihA/YsxC [Bacteroidales bacterium]